MTTTTLDTRAAAEHCGLTVRQFRLGQEDGWTGLLNRPLPFRSEPNPGRGGYPRHLYSEADVDHLAALLRQRTGLAPGWVDDHTYRDAAGEWVTDAGGAERFGLPARSLRRWRKARCRYNGGKVIASQRVDAPCGRRARGRGKGKVHVYSVAELQHVAQNYASNMVRDVYRDPGGAVYLTAAQIVERYEVSHKLVMYWAAKASRLRPGKALRSLEVVNNVWVERGGQTTIRVYLQDDLERILRDEETLHPGAGRVCKRVPAGGAPAVPSAESRTAGASARPGPLPVEPYPVYILQPDGKPVPVVYVAAPEPAAANAGGPRQRGGRPRSDKTAEVYKFCYEERQKGKKRSAIRAAAAKLFGTGAPKEDRDVTLFARRYEKRLRK